MVVILDCFVYEHKFLLNIKWARLVAILKNHLKKERHQPAQIETCLVFEPLLYWTLLVLYSGDDQKEGDHLNTKYMVVWYSDHEMNN